MNFGIAPLIYGTAWKKEDTERLVATAKQTLLVWRAFEKLVDAGGVRQLGISNCYERSQLETLFNFARIKPKVLQNRFYADTGYDAEIRAYCVDRQIRYQSFWTLTANPHLLSHAIARELAARYARTPAQILFRCLTQIGITPLTGTRSEVHMREDLAIAEFELDPVDCRALMGIFQSY
jgi:diketogulonate reductase-like aldo/keto reductase